MGLNYTVVARPIEMSQKVITLSLQLVLFFAIFLADVGSSSFNITRHTTGDVFQNTNSSKSCNKSGASCVFDGENSPFCGENCCSCVCSSQTPTYLLRDENCTSEGHLMSILKAQGSKQGCDYRMVVAESHLQCQKEVLTTLNTLNPGSRTLYLCPWNKGLLLLHFQLVKHLHKCEIVPEESLYLNGSWQLHPRHDRARSKLNIRIGQDPAVSDGDKLFLEWFADIGKEYDGLIFSLKLKCRGTGEKALNSCVLFKKGGSFTDVKPTLTPTSIVRDRAPNTIVRNRTEQTDQTAFPALPHTKKPVPSTMHAATFLVENNLVASSTSSQPKLSIVVVILAALSGVLFGSLAILAVFVLIWRRRRQFDVGEKAKDDPRPNQHLTSNRGIRSSNYLSLLKEDPEEAREYQTLMKDTNPVKLEVVDENKIPDYAELEERTDSEDSVYSSDSQDYEEPPVVDPKRRRKRIAPRRQKLNNLSSDINEYDEPEGIIVMSDNEGDPNEQAKKDKNDFHNNADLDNTNENNVNSQMVPNEDLPCYHDYDDPE